MNSSIFKNLSETPLTKHIENINYCNSNNFQLLEINLEQDFKSPLDNNNFNEIMGIDEFNLELPYEQKFSPCEDKKRELNLEAGIWDLETNKFELDFIIDENMRSPKKTLLDEWKNIQSPKEKNNNIMNVDENDFPTKNVLNSLLEKKKPDKIELKKQFLDEDAVMNISNHNMVNNLSNQTNNLNHSNTIKSPEREYKENNKKDYVKQRIKDDIKNCKNALKDLKGLNARNIKYLNSNDNKSIDKGIKILKKYLNNEDIVKEYKVILFLTIA